MKKSVIVCGVILAAMAALLWQRREADVVSTEITALNSRMDQVAQETGQIRAALEKTTTDIAEREQLKNMLERTAVINPANRAPLPAAKSVNSISTIRPSEYYWSDANDTAWLPKDCLPRLGIRVLCLDTNNAWRITSHAAAALVLSENEQAALNQTLAEAEHQYQELARVQFSQVIWPTPEEELRGLWRAKYQVSAFPAETAALRKQFADSVTDILKGEKAKLFLEFMGQRVDTPFSPFGKKEMSILFEWTRTPDAQWALQITETGTDNSRPVKCGQTTTRRLEQTNIPPYWRPLIQLPLSQNP